MPADNSPFLDCSGLVHHSSLRHLAEFPVS
jgi:hypothetical protein